MKNVHFLSSRRLGLACVMATLAAVLPLQALSQVYPAKPVKVLVGFTAGGAVDLIARSVGQVMQVGLGQPIVVENKPGAGTNIAMKALIDAPPDGYTLMLTANSIAANPALYKPAPFDPEKDVAPVALVGRVPVVIAANAASPYTSVAQLIQAAKGKPNSIAYGSPGNGATPHMAMEFFTRAAGVDLQHIPYKGGSQAITDAIGGQIPLVAVNALEVLPHVKSGKLRVIAVLSPGRSSIYPDVPTIAESGFPGFEASVWYGFIAPAATPKAVVERLHAEVEKALQNPEVRASPRPTGWLDWYTGPCQPRFKLPAGSGGRPLPCLRPGCRVSLRARAQVHAVRCQQAQLFALRDHLGFARNVIVQATCHGADNRAMVDACLRQRRQGAWRGHGQAQRDGRRTAGPARRRRARRALQLRQAPGGLHAQGRADGNRRPHRQAGLARGDLLRGGGPARAVGLLHRLPTTVVVDHMGRPDVSLPVDGPQFALFEKFMREHTNVWSKVSCPERLSVTGPKALNGEQERLHRRDPVCPPHRRAVS
jgi:tripartite-type tricarboxylate transporter receptor subunit TctC